MTRLTTEGFELGDYLGVGYFDCSIRTNTPRTGSYYIEANGNGSYWTISFSSKTEIYAFTGYMNQNQYRANILEFVGGGVSIARIYNDGNPFPLLYFEGSYIGASALPFSQGVWGMYELHLKIDDAPNGVLEAKFNGNLFASFYGDTKVSATSLDTVRGVRTYEGSHFWDDIAVNDSLGVEDNSWVGDCHVEYLRANDNGDTNQWTGSDGDKVNNYALVNDVPHDGDASYVQSSTLGEQDMYGVADFSGAGKIIRRIWPECRSKDNRNTSGQIKIGYKTGGSVYLGGAQSLSGIYGCLKGDAPTTNPTDSLAWEDADLDAIQFVTECE